jgi:hypothetical protein
MYAIFVMRRVVRLPGICVPVRQDPQLKPAGTPTSAFRQRCLPASQEDKRLVRLLRL